MDLVWYLGLHAQVSQNMEKPELEYGTITSFNVLMQNLYKLSHTRTERVPASVTWLEGALNAIQ